MDGKCPHCNSTNLSTEPVYPDDEEWDYIPDDENDPGDQIAVFCVTCGHYLGTIQSELRGANHSLANKTIQDFFKAD